MKKKTSPIVFEELDLSKSDTWNGQEGVRDFIIQRLKTLQLYSPNLVFRGFNGKRMEMIKKNGVDIFLNGYFFGSTEVELASETRIEQSAIDYALRNDIPGLAVYDGEKFLSFPQTDCEYMYELKKGVTYKEALLAVFILKN